MRNLGFERGGRDIMSTLKLTLLTDLYEMTMMQGYFKNNKNDRVVFDAFYRSDPSRKNPAGGSGLGLAIAAKAVQGMGGAICAVNCPGGGLAIEITLPKAGGGDAENPADPG